MEPEQIAFLVRTLLLVLVVFATLLGVLAGFLKGLYKTTTKTILKVILLIVAASLAVPISNLVSNIEIQPLNSLWQNVSNNSEAALVPPTLQNFVSSYLRQRTDFSPRNGISVYQRCWNLASSVLATVVFFLERIILQIFISLITAIVYNGIIRWIIPAETPKEWKARRKKKKRNSLTSGRKNDDGSVSASKTRKKWHLHRLPSAILGGVQEFAFSLIVISPLTGVARRAVQNKEVIGQVLSKEEDKKTRNAVRDSVSNSLIYKINGVNDWDRALRNKATEFESAGGVKVSFAGLVDSALDVAKPLLDANAISYNAAGTRVINYSALLSTGTVSQLLAKIAANKQIRALVPSLVEAASSSLTGTNFPVQQLSRKDISWKEDIDVFSGIYQSRYQYLIQPRITSDNKIDPSKLALDPSSRTDAQIDEIASAIGSLGKRERFSKNRPVLLAYAGRYSERQGIDILPSNPDDYKDIQWSSEFTILFKNILKIARALDREFSSNTNWNTLPDKIRDGFSDPATLSTIRSCFLGTASDKGIRDRKLLGLISIPNTMKSIVGFIPGRSQYAKLIDFDAILGDFDSEREKQEISKRFDIRQILFDPECPFDIKAFDKIDLSDDKTCETLSLIFEKATDSVLFSSLLPVVSKAFFFNSGFDFSQYRFSLNPYCFNYDDPDFMQHREEVLKLRPKRMERVKKRNDSSLSDEIKVKAIDTETLKSLLEIVVDSEFFNSSKETGITGSEQKNANLYYFLKGLFSSDLFKNFQLTAPSREERSSIKWTGEDGEINRLCQILDSAKENSRFIFGSNKKLNEIDNFDAVGNLLKTGRESEIVRPCALQIIDQSLNTYLENIGIHISFDDRRNQRWVDDSENIADILRLLQDVDLDNFDLSSLDTDKLNALLTLLSKRNIILTSNKEADPFGYSLYKRITSNASLKDRGLGCSRKASIFLADASDPWIGSTETVSFYGKSYTIDKSGRISSLCYLRQAIKDIGIENLSSGKLPKGFVSNPNLQEAIASPFIRKLFASFLKQTLSTVDRSAMSLKGLDFLDTDLLENRDKAEFKKTLDFVDFLYALTTDKIDGTAKIELRLSHPFEWSTRKAYPEITDPSSAHYNETFLDVFNERMDSRTTLEIFVKRKAGYSLSPIATILEKVIEKMDRTDLRTRHQDQKALDGIFASVLQDDWVLEGNHFKRIVEQMQGKSVDKISWKERTYEFASTLMEERNKSALFHRVPITLREQSIQSTGLETYLADPDTGETLHPLNFRVHLSSSKEDTDFWQNEIYYGLNRVCGEDSPLYSLLNGSKDLTDASIEAIDLTFRYYLGKRKLFGENRSYLFYNLIDRLTKDAVKNSTTSVKVSLFAISEKAPYGESKKAYRLEELFFQNPKLLNDNGELDEAKALKDLREVKSVLVSIFAELPNLIDENKIALVNFDFEARTLACLENDNGTLARSDFASEVFAGTRNAFFQNPRIVTALGSLASSYDFYADNHALVNPMEGRALNGLLKLSRTVPASYTRTIGSTSRTLSYYTKERLDGIYPLFGDANPYPDDILYSSFYQGTNGNSVFAKTYQDKLFSLPVIKTRSPEPILSDYTLFSNVATIDLSARSVKGILDSVSGQIL